MDYLSPDGKEIIFVTENIENIPAGWCAKETSKLPPPDEFIEIFELAARGKDFEVYTQCHLKRKTE